MKPLRLWAYQQIAHGADAIVFFRWRTARFGTEEYWHGMLYHDGRTSRRYDVYRRRIERALQPALQNGRPEWPA